MDRFASDLPAAPASLYDAAGQPLQGRFAGRCDRLDWRGLPAALQRPGWWRLLHHKRWQYIGIACGDCFIGCAIVDVGWTNTAFAYLFDRASGKVIGSLSRDGLPGLTAKVADVPATGEASRFAWLGARISFIEQEANLFSLAVSGPGGFRVTAELDGRNTAPWLFACGPVEGGVWHATHKSPALAVRGEAHAAGKVFPLDGAHASLDHSNGLLPRDTRWLWASAHAAEVGFNLQAGYFGNHENVLWLDGKLIALGAARFEFDPADTQAVWRVSTDDGLLDLRFQPEGERREDRNLLIAASHYVQPVGVYSGWVRATMDEAPRLIEGLLGVAEQHHSRW
ncbi:DUF2804 domain-containing protein [Chitinimonas arctica]|uniref:DUF2804 domain-containing protein n=1 Tax=Chitinimonas arctica TaxID=2594795 RepID=A0A516SGD2_9NEIS|nr:DUF2804 domain-containing protein [Chitinimonas arctica]QDQ27221.1 DUF2804 domain-containing protein [Chitinimonas arctica]